MRTFTILSSMALLSLGGGYAWHHAVNPSPVSEEQGEGVSSTDRELRTITRGRRLQKSLRQSEGTDYWLQWVGGVEKASLSELPELARLAAGNELALELIAHRWLELDPEDLLAALSNEAIIQDGVFPAEELARNLFRLWSEKDPEVAIAKLSGPDPLNHRDELKEILLTEVFVADPERAIELIAQWNVCPDYDQVVQRLMKTDPRSFADLLYQHPVNLAMHSLQMYVSGEWSKSDPEGALKYAAEMEDSTWGKRLRDDAFHSLLENDFPKASEWLEGQSAEWQEYYRGSLVGKWAKLDPQAALEWTRENLEGSAFQSSLGRVALSLVHSDRETAMSLVGELEPKSHQGNTVFSMAGQLFGTYDQPVTAYAVSWISSLEDSFLKERALSGVSFTWAQKDPEGMRDFLDGDNQSEVSSKYFGSAARGLARKDGREAVRWAESLDGDKAVVAASSAFRVWLSSESAEATAWFQDLPKDDGRRAAIVTSTGGMFAYRYDQDPTILQNFTPAERAEIRQSVLASKASQKEKDRALRALAE